MPRSTIPIATPYVHVPCPLENPLMGFFPFRHLKPEDFQRVFRCLVRPRTFQGFGYPSDVQHLPASQVLFHTCNARRVSLTEPCSWFKAVTISGSLLPCRSFYRFKPGSRGTQTLNPKTQASKLCSLNQAVPGQNLLGIAWRAFCSHRFITSKAGPQTVKQASLILLFRSYPKTCC